jgi:hypothetical protein
VKKKKLKKKEPVKERISKQQLGWISYAELKAQEVLEQAEQRRRALRAEDLGRERQRRDEALRFSRFKAREARGLVKTSNKILKKLKWDEAVCLLTSAVSEAIWREGGMRADALATAEIVFHAICRDLNALFDGKKNVVPFKRNPDYFKQRVERSG